MKKIKLFEVFKGPKVGKHYNYYVTLPVVMPVAKKKNQFVFGKYVKIEEIIILKYFLNGVDAENCRVIKIDGAFYGINITDKDAYTLKNKKVAFFEEQVGIGVLRVNEKFNIGSIIRENSDNKNVSSFKLNKSPILGKVIFKMESYY